jgi:hypothetical protein
VVELVVCAVGILAGFVGFALDLRVLELAGFGAACMSFGVVIARTVLGRE